jgi:hypothetical protein
MGTGEVAEGRETLRTADLEIGATKLREIYARTFRPCFSTISSSLRAMPLGFFAPDSHFSMVDSLVLR